jgi:hypothetical protein
MFSRRQLLKYLGAGTIAVTCEPFERMNTHFSTMNQDQALRSINIVNFLRAVEPRGPMDLFLPLQKQMEVIKENNLPATWLLQFDALVSGPFVKYLKENMPKNHEVGIWFEMNEMHCNAAQVKWRGRPGYEWDHYPSVAFTIGYTPEERIKLADAFMLEFKKVWGYFPKSVASWNLDSITMQHLSDEYSVDAFAVCRDQIATDGFTIWGAPIAGYYPSKSNCWSPAVNKNEQISTPVLRMLGQDPVYYYFRNGFPMPNGQRGSGPDTMEPVWPSGRSNTFINNFLDMIAINPTLNFAYAQLGQENSFGWPEMEAAYPVQMKALANLQNNLDVHIETMGDTGRRFKKAFKETPAQAQIMLKDSFGNDDPKERSVWYQSRFYRANLHFHGDLPFLRDITVYNDKNAQPFLTIPTQSHDVEQRMPSIIDGYHWSTTPGSAEPGAGGFFLVNQERLRLTGDPQIEEKGSTLTVKLPVTGARILTIKFEQESFSIWLSEKGSQLVLSFEWDSKHETLVRLEPHQAHYRWQGFEYYAKIQGNASKIENGWKIQPSRGPIALKLNQHN